MKRSAPEGTPSSGSLSDKRNAGVTFYMEEEKEYTVNERMVYYKPNPLNNRIVSNSPSLKMIKKFGMLPDFEINDDICVFVRDIGDYTKRPEEVFSMHRKLSAPNQPTSHSYVLSVFLLILGRDAMNTIAVEEVSAKCVFEGLSFLICWSVEEAASYLNTIKAYETRGSDIIQKHTHKDLESQAVRVLTNINGVNVVAWGESEG
ncbi:hypothetical protein WA577_003371 [Blastocystis sp. JDR]